MATEENDTLPREVAGVATAAAGAAVGSGGAAGGIVAAGEATYPVAPGYRVNVRSGPTTTSPVVRVLAYDARVRIRCQRRGQSVKGPYGLSSIWDSIAPGEYISDAYVRTGSDGYVAPSCG
ncbi:SH3 domain-containing protein [Streptomyces buecherae]|uniref:SH3 domain-containing protein n=1 Tax=Streptomyces buecherae TaxID=2763006 RepID=UPI001E3F728E|nr:SH3 domain-containing protein [Streptomyces buecherae]